MPVHHPAYRPRMTEALRACAIAEQERMRILREYRTAGDHAWMYPVVVAIDYVAASAYLLEECLTCEDAESCPYFASPPHRDLWRSPTPRSISDFHL